MKYIFYLSLLLVTQSDAQTNFPPEITFINREITNKKYVSAFKHLIMFKCTGEYDKLVPKIKHEISAKINELEEVLVSGSGFKRIVIKGYDSVIYADPNVKPIRSTK